MSKNAKTATEPANFRSLWLSHRRKRFWAIVAVILYTLAGFFLVPVLLGHFTVKGIKDATGRDASIAELRFNPYVLSLQVNGFDFRDNDGETLISFDELFVNFQASSLFRWALTFREIRLDGAYVFYERFSPEDDRLSRLLADVERLNPSDAAEPESDGSLPRLLIGTFALNRGEALFRDHVGPDVVEIPAGPISVTIHDLNTLPDVDGEQDVQIRLARGAVLTWRGDIQLQPFYSKGHLSLEGARLDPLLPYLESAFPIESLAATLSIRSDYLFETGATGELSFSLSKLESTLSDVSVRGLDPTSEFLAFPQLAVAGGELRYPENTLDIQSVRLTAPFLDTWLGEDGQPGLLQLAPASGENTGSAEPWTVSVTGFQLENGSVTFVDRSMQPNLALGIENLSLHLDGIDNRDHTEMPLSLSFDLEGGGSGGFEGALVLLPDLTLNGNITADSVPLGMGQPYAQQSFAISIEDGDLATSSEFSLAPGGEIHLAGNLTVNNLMVRDTAENNELLAWKQVFIDRYEVGGEEAVLRVSTIAFSEPYCRLHIRKDLSTNIGSVFLETEEAEAAGEGGGDEFTFIIGALAVDNGTMDFSDFSLPLPFATKMLGLNGTVSAIDSHSAEPSDIRLEGRVDDYGIARIHGIMYLLDPVIHTDLSVEFRNLLMTDLSPYSAQFAGREIDEGKLDLELEYVIDEGLLSGINSAVLSDLKLGKEVESPDAVSLPLDLAVALLKDSKGVIDVKLPVEGDINNPEFKLGGVVWQAVKGLVVKVATAPFRMLGNLIGIDSEDFGTFKFLGGRYDLAPPEIEKIDQLTQALAQRPELSLEIGGTWNATVDRPSLQYYALRADVGERLRRDYSERGEIEEMFDEEVLKIFEELHAERFPDMSLDEMKARHFITPPGDPEGKPEFDQTAYAAELRNFLVDAEPVDETDMRELAGQRAQAVLDAFMANGNIDPARVRLADPAEGESDDGEWVSMELAVSHD